MYIYIYMLSLQFSIAKQDFRYEKTSCAIKSLKQNSFDIFYGLISIQLKFQLKTHSFRIEGMKLIAK
jgi:hypothetical protein